MLPLTLSIYAWTITTNLYTSDPVAISAVCFERLFFTFRTPMTMGTVIYTAVQGLGNALTSFFFYARQVLECGASSIGTGYLMGIVLDGVCLVFGLERFWIMVSVDFLRYRYKLYMIRKDKKCVKRLLFGI